MQGNHNDQISGDLLDHCRDAAHCFMCHGSEHVRYSMGLKSTDSINEYVMDVDHFGLGIQRCYE